MLVARFTGRLGIALLSLTSVGATGCGGGGDDGGESTLTISPSTDGTVKSSVVLEAGGASAISVGDDAANNGLKGILRFGIVPFVPTGSVILSAKLRLQQQAVVGNPFPSFGVIVVDSVDPGFTIEGSDYNAPVLSTIGTLSGDATLGVKELDVTAAVIADFAGPGFNSNFLLRFSVQPSDGDSVADTVLFEDFENDLGTGITPQLVITYQ